MSKILTDREIITIIENCLDNEGNCLLKECPLYKECENIDYLREYIDLYEENCD